MQQALSVVSAPDRGPDVYTNREKLFQPVWGRGIFGGALIAQGLTAAQETVPSNFLVHSIHSHFILAAKRDIPIFYHVDRVRDGKAIATRLVLARQSGTCIFSATLSFMLHESAPGDTRRPSLRHQAPMPADFRTQAPPSARGQPVREDLLTETCLPTNGSLFECVRVPLDHRQQQQPEAQKLRQWSRAAGRIRGDGGPFADARAHLAALAYLTDNYFIGTVARAHRASRFSSWDMSRLKTSASGRGPPDGRASQVFLRLAREETEENLGSVVGARRDRAGVGMMVTLSHTIFFHNQTAVEADDWMLSEMETPWAGDERGIVIQKMWTRDGILIATCIQEGLIRLKQEHFRGKI